jgi:thiamine pyrophosphate-dependent acetolactate synthase large subunit-like protein
VIAVASADPDQRERSEALTNRESVGEAVIRLLQEHGTEVVFGIPGVHTLELFRGIGRYGMRHALNRHEQGVAFAADGYARVSGKPGVALIISGPGLTNAATAIAQAYHDSIPLLVISAALPTEAEGRGWGALHEMPDQSALMSTITAWSERVESPGALPGALARAFDLFASGRPRPVHIQLPADVIKQQAPALEPIASAGRKPLAADEDVADAATLLSTAERPFVVLGGGAVDAGAEAIALAERIGAPIAMSLNAKGTVPDDYPLSLGTTLPTAAVLDEIEQADALLAVGTEFCEVDYYYATRMPQPEGRIVRVDIDPRQLAARYAPAVALHGDSAQTLARLAERVDGGDVAAGAARRDAVVDRVRWWEGATPLLPAVEALRAVLPRDAIVAVDSTQLAYVGQNVWPAWTPRSWMVPAGFGTLGPALPMILGAHMAGTGRPLVCIAGDGGFFYTMEELASAVDLGVTLPIVLWNNGGYGEIRVEMEQAGIDPIGTRAVAHDWCAIARGFGSHAVQARTLEALQQEVTAALERTGPTLIETGPALGLTG